MEQVKGGLGQHKTHPKGHLSLEFLLKRDRWIVISLLSFFIGLCWYFVFSGAGISLDEKFTHWTSSYGLKVFLTWWGTTLAIVLPSAVPMVLIYTALVRKMLNHGIKDTLAFLLTYTIAWALFAVIATLGQRVLIDLQFFSPETMSMSNPESGYIFVLLAGIWQVTPMKEYCLRRCRTTIQFYDFNWNRGDSGAFRLGFEHGLVCVGSSWLLLACLFCGGLLNLWWVLALTVYILAEKIVPFGIWVSKGIGVILFIWSGFVLVM